MSADTYKVVRMFFNQDVPNKIIKTGLTLKEAQAHCKDPETSSVTCSNAEGKACTEKCGEWFDGYEGIR